MDLPSFSFALSIALAAAPVGLPARASSTPAASEDARGQTADASRVTDHDLCFELTRPGPGWTLLDEEQVRVLNPAAVAGASLDGGALFALVLAEYLPGAEIDETARNLEASLGFDAVRREEWGPVELHGQPAWRFRLDATTQGNAVGYGDTLFLTQDFLFQLVVFEPARDRSNRAENRLQQGLEQLERAFQPTPGAVHARRELPPAPNAVGLGWRVMNGVYEDGAYGFRIEPESRWQIETGSELESGARVALVDGARRIVLRAERITGLDPTAWARAVYRDFDVELPRSSARGSRRLITGAGEVVFDRYMTSGDGAEELLFGVAFREDLALRIDARAPIGSGDLGTALQLALRGLEVLAPDDRNRLAAPWAGYLGDLDAGAGPGWSYRNRTWRDYALGLELVLPDGCWEVARERFGEGTDFALVDAGRGLTLDIERRVIVGVSASEWHERWKDQLEREGWAPEGPPEAVQLESGEPAHITQMRGELGSLPATLELLTAERGGLGVALRTSGYPGCLMATRESRRALLSGLRFHPEGLKPVSTTKQGARDERLGWSLEFPTTRWETEQELSPGVLATSYTVSWKRNGIRATLHVRRDTTGDAGLIATADEVARSLTSGEPWLRAITADERVGELDGRPALLREWSSKKGQARLWCARRGELVFALALTEAGLFAGDGFASLHEAFRFL